MKKLIDIEENQKQSLQILAAKSGKDLKNYIQDILTVKHQYQDSGQITRAILNDVTQTFVSIEGNYYESEDIKVNDLKDYCDLVIAMCNQIKSVKV